MTHWRMTGVMLLTALVASLAHAQSLDANARAERDARRLAEVARQHQASAARDTAGDERRERQRAALQRVESRLATRQSDNELLRERVRLLDDDLAQLQAVSASTLQTQRARLQRSPLGADRADLIADINALAQQSASLDVLYGTWFSLHEEWLAGGQITRPQEALTLASGVRRTEQLTRYGAIALAHQGQPVEVTADAGLIVQAAATPAGISTDYLRQQIYDSGAIGVALLLCALAAIVIALRRRGLRLLNLIASASLLLGLLGTVVGLIHTFRALARYGGTDASVAAAGISHALATTWMGLVIAISLMLLGPLLSLLPERASRLRSPQNTTASWRWPARIRGPTAFAAASCLGLALFYLMQWLTHRPLSPQAPPASPVRVERIDWSTPPPPPPPPSSAPAAVVDLLPSAPSFSVADVAPLRAPAPGVSAPALNIAPSLTGLGDGGLPAAGTLWRGATGGAGIIEGSDLVPISSARPRYPKAALEARIDGWVEAIFRIDAAGRVSNVRIIDAEPPGVFEQAAAQALERWLYAPLYRDGRPVAREATQLLRFDHRQARNTYLNETR